MRLVSRNSLRSVACARRAFQLLSGWHVRELPVAAAQGGASQEVIAVHAALETRDENGRDFEFLKLGNKRGYKRGERICTINIFKELPGQRLPGINPMKKLLLTGIAALFLATGTQSAQALPKCTSKLECDARALNRARNDSRFVECRTSFIAKAIARGDQRMQRIANEYERRGGGVGRGVDAANSLRDNLDWQWAGARASRACARYAK